MRVERITQVLEMAVKAEKDKRNRSAQGSANAMMQFETSMINNVDHMLMSRSDQHMREEEK